MSSKLITKNIFGTDGIRGRANKGVMSPGYLVKIGQALGHYFRETFERPRVIIGKDTRLSGYMVEQALSSGLCSMGVETLFAGPLPTPGIAYLSRGLRLSGGIVISASHNPFYDNGIKVFRSDGYKLDDVVEAYIESLIDSEELEEKLAKDEALGTSIRIEDALGQYGVFLKEQFPRQLTLQGITLVLDCANGASYKIAPKVFEELGAKVFVIHDTPNGTNINHQSGALYPQILAKEVVKHRAHIGFAYDGDADRMVAIDETGAILDGDELLGIFSLYMKKNNTLYNSTVVGTLMTNMGLENELAKHNIQLIRTPVGDRYIMETLNQQSLSLGGESSGHFIFPENSTTGDGLLASLKLLQIMLEENCPLSTLKERIFLFPQISEKLPVKSKVPMDQLLKLNTEIEKVVKTLAGKGRVLCRYSGTESMLRFMVEGPDLEQLQGLMKNLVFSAHKDFERIHGTTPH